MCIRLPAGIDIDMACAHVAKEYEEETFCLVDDGFDPLKIAAFAWNGFFPMASCWSGEIVSLAKIHERRCVLRLDDMHITRKVRKRAQRFVLTVDTAWDQAFAGLKSFHDAANGTCWLYDPIRTALQKLYSPQPPTAIPASGVAAATSARSETQAHLCSLSVRELKARLADLGVDHAHCIEKSDLVRELGTALVSLPPEAPPARAHQNVSSSRGRDGAQPSSQERPVEPTRGVRFHTVELWDRDTGALAAVDVGLALGSVYTSMSGYSNRDFPSAGMVQIAALAALLKLRGFEAIDFGMAMDYKLALGAKELPRSEWLAMVRRTRSVRPSPSLALLCPPASLSAAGAASCVPAAKKTKSKRPKAEKPDTPRLDSASTAAARAGSFVDTALDPDFGVSAANLVLSLLHGQRRMEKEKGKEER